MTFDSKLEAVTSHKDIVIHDLQILFQEEDSTEAMVMERDVLKIDQIPAGDTSQVQESKTECGPWLR